MDFAARALLKQREFCFVHTRKVSNDTGRNPAVSQPDIRPAANEHL